MKAIQAQIEKERKEQLRIREKLGLAFKCDNCGTFDKFMLLCWHIARRATTYRCVICKNMLTRVSYNRQRAT